MRGYGTIKTNQPGWMEKEKPVAGPLDAILRPIALAPCTSDVHSMHGGSGDNENLILGHEAIGEIVEVGNMVSRFKPGDKVVVPCCTPDWLKLGVQGGLHESYNNAHDETMMSSFKFLLSKDGTFAEFFHVNHADANLVLLPDDIGADAALMTVDMMSTGFYGVEMADVGFGDTVCVIGIGPIGLMAVAAAKLKGAGRIIGIGTRPNCVKVAQEYGATDIVSYKKGPVADQVIELTKGGADRVIISGGNQETFAQAVTMCKPGGVVANVNYFDSGDILSMAAPLWGLGMANKNIKSGFCPGGAVRIEKMLNLIRYNRVDPTKMITHRYDGFEKIEDAFLLMDQKPADLIKPAVFINW